MTAEAVIRPARRRRRWLALTLRTRLLLLVVASTVPLLGMAIFRESNDFAADRRQIDNGLLSVARGTAVAIERDFSLRISSLETLAMSPALQAGDLDRFDAQAKAFIARQPKGTTLAILTPDTQIQRVYGEATVSTDAIPKRAPTASMHQMFLAGHPSIVDLHIGRLTHTQGFSIDVPVFRDGEIVYNLSLRLTPSVLVELLAGQHLASDRVLTVIDTSGVVVARIPNGNQFIGSHIVAKLWEAIETHPEGVVEAPTLEGTPAVGAFTHIGTTGWSVAVGAPKSVILAPVWAAVVRVVASGATVLVAGLVAASFLARGITRPIERLRRLASMEEPSEALSESGLPETDQVAYALIRAANERREAARALAESEERFRALFERSPSGTILLDPVTTRVIDCNEAAAAFVGCNVDRFRGSPITDYAQQTTPERVHQICQGVLRGETFRYETRVRGYAGERDLLIAAAPVQVGGRILMLITQIDVTDLREAQAGLRVNEERLELARQGADLGIWDWDVANDTLTWSDHQWVLHGLTPHAEGPSRAEWATALNPADRDRVREELRQAILDPEYSYATEYSVILRNGSVRRLLARGRTIRNASGRAIRMVGINMDVTARYEAESARDRLIQVLETERSRLASIIDSMQIGVGIIDAKGRVILGNAMMRRLSGPIIPSFDRSQADNWAGHNKDGSRIDPSEFPGARALRGETVLPGIDLQHRAGDGSQIWVRAGATPLRWDNGKVQEALLMLQDIDAEKRLMALQQETNARLEQRVREEMAAREAAQQRAAHAERMHALGQIAGGIAHDFNNVLQAISGGAALIERRPADPERVLRNSRMIADAARRGAAITSRLLAFARRGDLRAETIDVSALLTDMAEVLTHTLGGSVVCKVEVPPVLPPLFADRGQLETVLVNLATNARDAMPSGGTLTLHAEVETVSSGAPHPAGLMPGGYIRIVAKDTGCGMDQTVLARVTEPFFTTKEPGKGTGLGLAMAKGFAEQSGGSLTIESAEGLGTSINLWLPQAAGHSAQDGAQGGVSRGYEPEGPRVLLVDDDAIVRQVLAMSLEDAGHGVLAVESGATAMAVLREGERVDIMVSDLTMPGMDGLTLIRSAQAERPGLPAILLTGYAGDGAALAVGGAISGTFSLLRKPVSGTQLVDRITALLASQREASKA